MKQLNKMILLAMFMSMVSISAKAQQTSMTIDNQSPGWLSSKIGYGDQRTLQNLKVTGYLNKEDMIFIANLTKKHSLHGRLDLEDANFVGDTSDNYFFSYEDIFYTSKKTPSISLQYFSYPKSLNRGGSEKAMNNLIIDTLFINTTTGFTQALGAEVKHVVIGDNVVAIKYPSFGDVKENTIETVSFPPTLRDIRGENEFTGKGKTIEIIIKNGKNLKVFPSLERFFAYFTVEEDLDSIYFPNIKMLNLCFYSKNKEEKKHVFIGEKIDTLSNYDYHYSGYPPILHFSSPTPPRVMGRVSSEGAYSPPENVGDNYFILYVPKGSASAYRACFENGGTNVTIIEEEQPVTGIKLEKHETTLDIGECQKLKVEIQPYNADNKNVIWSSDDPDIVSVDMNGEITAMKSGETFVRVVSVDGGFADSCLVHVIYHVTGISLDKTSITFNKIGEMEQLVASIIPSNAYDNRILWESSNTSVCIVSSSGIVVAVGVGTSVVSATTVEGGYVAVCIVTVKESDGIMTIDVDALTGNETIYDVQGKRISKLQRGINIIRMTDGTTRKVVVE